MGTAEINNSSSFWSRLTFLNARERKMLVDDEARAYFIHTNRVDVMWWWRDRRSWEGSRRKDDHFPFFPWLLCSFPKVYDNYVWETVFRQDFSTNLCSISGMLSPVSGQDLSRNTVDSTSLVEDNTLMCFQCKSSSLEECRKMKYLQPCPSDQAYDRCLTSISKSSKKSWVPDY